MSRWLIIGMVAATLSPVSLAQMRGGFGHAPGFGPGFGFAGHRGRGFGDSLILWGGPDYPAGSLAYAAPSPPVVIVQPPAAVTAPEPKSEPLLIEWQGDRYVRFRGQHEAAEKSFPDYSEGSASTRLSKPVVRAATPADELPPAVLVYRDGHREEASDYVITNGVLYVRGDPRKGESWTRTIQLSALDIPQTIKANQGNGVKFVLPSWANEVVTRP